MNEVGIIDLPRLRLNPPQKSRRPKDRWKEIFKERKEPIEGSLSNLEEIELQMVRSSTEKRFWNYLIDKYHYLGYGKPIGKQIKYFVYSKENLLGCIGFADAVLKLNLRENGLAGAKRQGKRIFISSSTMFAFLFFPGSR